MLFKAILKTFFLRMWIHFPLAGSDRRKTYSSLSRPPTAGLSNAISVILKTAG